MPELPEVEVVRRGLERLVVGRRVVSMELRRADVLQPTHGMRRGPRREPGSTNSVTSGKRAVEAAGHTTGHTVPGSHIEERGGLLAGRVIVSVRRHGKRLAIVGDDGSAVGVHLGMTGRVEVAEDALGGGPGDAPGDHPPHTHALWRLEGGRVMRFVDPRRFGGLWDWPPPGSNPGSNPAPAPGNAHGSAVRNATSRVAAEPYAGSQATGFTEPVAQPDASRGPAGASLWFRGLGPDALGADAAELAGRLRAGRRAIKAVLLDQAVLAGLGNIYADEALFAARVSPLRRAERLRPIEADRLTAALQDVLRAAVEGGGSTLRDYAGPSGEAGRFQASHRVYGRAGRPCVRCGAVLLGFMLAGRMTACCPACQSTSRAGVTRRLGPEAWRQGRVASASEGRD
ncbi:MAG: DNA-formamidopyrimidine glycosylase family protein [Planctomycetota bacterium]